MLRSRILTLLAGIGSLVLLIAVYLGAAAEDPANQYFFGVWQRTDQPVHDGQVTRTWMWGPEAFTPSIMEPYEESPGDMREVQYFDKSRMEITHPTTGDPDSIWYVTNGLLVNELMTGQLQLGDNTFEQHAPAEVNVGGDPDDILGPTYAVMANLRATPSLPAGSIITQTIDRNGNVRDDQKYAQYGVTAAHRVQVPQIDHQVASPFWDFMNSIGLVIEDGELVSAPLFVNPYFATGFPVTEAYWTDIKVAGSVKAVLIQCFERRCLTYTPSNAPQWRVEQGNVGQHYYRWRYEQIVATPTPTSTTPAGTPTATATATQTATATITATATTVPPSNYVYTSKFGLPSEPTRNLVDPFDIAFDPSGNIYVTERDGHRVLKFDSDGIYLTQWGTNGTGASQFNSPHGIEVVVQASGTWAYIADRSNHRIQVFDTDGMYIGQWGTPGTGNGQFQNPSDIAADSAGNIYVADANNDRIQKFTATGTYLGQWNGAGGIGLLDTPSSIAIGPDDNVYVTEAGNARVQVFDTNGSYLRSWGSAGAGDGQFNFPIGIAISEDNSRVYVSEALGNRIQVFDTQGNYQTKWGGLPVGDAREEFNRPLGIALNGSGALYVADNWNNRVQIMSAMGFSYLGQITGDSRGRFLDPVGLKLDASGNIIVVDNDLSQVKLFTSSGGYLREWGDLGSHAPTDTPLSRPVDAAVDSQANIYVTDGINNRVVKYDAQGQQLMAWGATGTGNGQFMGPFGIAVDASDNVYVSDEINNRVQKFTSNGVFITAWGTSGNGNGEFDFAGGIAVTATAVYVTDQNSHRVQEFDLNGNYIRQWGSFGAGDGQFSFPVFIAVDAAGYIYVTDYGNHRVQKFTATGTYFAQFGTGGTGNGQFMNPTGIDVDGFGNIYVADELNSRVQVFNPVQ